MISALPEATEAGWLQWPGKLEKGCFQNWFGKAGKG